MKKTVNGMHLHIYEHELGPNRYRLSEDIRTLGAALVVGLVKGCLDAGVRFEVNVSVDRLVKLTNKVSGVELTKEGEGIRFELVKV